MNSFVRVEEYARENERLKEENEELIKRYKIIYLNKKLTVIFSVITIFNSNN